MVGIVNTNLMADYLAYRDASLILRLEKQIESLESEITILKMDAAINRNKNNELLQIKLDELARVKANLYNLKGRL